MEKLHFLAYVYCLRNELFFEN